VGSQPEQVSDFSLQFTAFFHWQQCPFTVYRVQVSPHIAHNVNEHSAFCHFTGWPISYCSFSHNLWFSQQCWWIFKSSGILHRAIGKMLLMRQNSMLPTCKGAGHEGTW